MFLQAAYEETNETKAKMTDLFKNMSQNMIISAPSMAEEYCSKKQVHRNKVKNSLQFARIAFCLFCVIFSPYKAFPNRILSIKILFDTVFAMFKNIPRTVYFEFYK